MDLHTLKFGFENECLAAPEMTDLGVGIPNLYYIAVICLL